MSIDNFSGLASSPSAPTQRETPLINHSWLVNNPLQGVKVGGSAQVSTNHDFVEVMNHRTGSVDLYLSKPFGRELVATKNSGDAQWTNQLKSTSSLTAAQRRGLIKELNSGSAFNKKLDNVLINTAAQDFKGGKEDAITVYKKSINLKQNPKAPGGTNIPVDPNANAGGSSSDLTPEQSKNIRDKISQSVEARTKYNSDSKLLKYPESYEGNDYLTIDMIRYVPESNLGLGKSPTDKESGNLLGEDIRRFSERTKDKETTLASITLPIPSNLVDGNAVNWGNSELNALQAYGAGAAGRILTGKNFGESLGKEIKSGGEVLRKQGDELKPILNSAIVSQILGLQGNDLLTRSTGAIINPNTELLFKSPGLRTFTFSFKMTPRSENEANNVRRIIRTLKQGMSVKRAGNGLFLATPNVFKLKFWYVNPDLKSSAILHPYLPVFKPCALQSISVNYMPDGSYMTYGDGSMVAYDMTLTFGEIEPIFDKDYDDLDDGKDTVIGY